jgi:aryl-alcohol dehydrogenase-like predicted oxidoreductase
MTTSASVPKRRLGKTDMEITPVGIGAFAMGGAGWAFSWGAQDDDESIAAIRHAVARGVNWIDTAPVYGLGHAEEVVTRALSGIPANEQPYVFTKCGLVWDSANPKTPAKRVGAPASLRREIEESLKRLGRERIDLYQMHWPAEDGTPLEVYWQTLSDLKKEGKVRAIGLSNHNAAQLAAAERVAHVDTLQPPFSAIRREVAEKELPWCLAHDTGVIVYSPMQAGLLTGRFSLDRARSLDVEDFRSRNPYFSGDSLKRSLKLVEELEPIAKRLHTTLASLAVAWTLGWGGVTAAIVGARAPAQVDGWFDAATLQLSAKDYSEIAAAIRISGAGEGPTAPSR